MNRLAGEGCAFLLDNFITLPGGRAKSIVPNREENDPLTHFEQIVYTSWGLRALILNRNFIAPQRASVLSEQIVPTQVEKIAKQTSIRLRLFSHDAVSSTGSVLQYQHRAGVGGIIVTLALAERYKLTAKVNPQQYALAVRKARSAALALRNPTNKLWCRDARRISMTPTVVLDLLYMTKYLGEHDKLPLAAGELEALLIDSLFANRVIDDLAKNIRTVLLDIVDTKDVAALSENLDQLRKAAEQRRKKKKKDG